jgi:MFS family permease
MNNENSRNWNLFLLLFGRTVSDVGSSIQMLVMPLYILDIGGTAGTIGLFSFLSLIPILIVFPLGGVLGDRFNRKGIMVTADFLSGTSLLALTTISYMGKINIPILLIVQVMVGMFYGFFEPASKGMIPQLVDSKDLNKANSKVATLRVFSGLVAPLIAVVLYTQYGITLLFLINAISFVLSGVSEIFIKFTHFPPKNIEEKKWIVNDLYQGFKFIKSSVTIRKLSFFFFIIFTNIQPLFAVVLPVFYRTQLSYKDTQYGLIQMALFLGAMVGSILVGKLIDDKNLKGWLINGFPLLL